MDGFQWAVERARELVGTGGRRGGWIVAFEIPEFALSLLQYSVLPMVHLSFARVRFDVGWQVSSRFGDTRTPAYGGIVSPMRVRSPSAGLAIVCGRFRPPAGISSIPRGRSALFSRVA